MQNLYNLTNRKSEDVLDYCEGESIGFIPWFPLAAGKLAEPGGPVDEIAKEHDATPRRSRSPGCSRAAPSCCRSRAPARSRTSRRTSPRPTCELGDDELERLDRAADD